tara:strand:+ start:181 stop:354 length:174 start_codon:yes stop_codon:yes gene_type:complete
MKTFIYYSKIDSKKEILGKIVTTQLSRAILKFATRKQLPKNTFLEIFIVEEYEEKEH